MRETFDLAEMQGLPLPRATAEHLTFNDAAGSDDYVSAFLPPRATKDRQFMCSGCGAALTGFMFGSFEWGAINGEGRCSACGYPTRMLHRLKRADGSELPVVQIPLQYHPEELQLEEAVSA